MKAVILAAGMASRLRPLTDKCPKCLLSVGYAKYMLVYIVDVVIRHIAIVSVRQVFFQMRLAGISSLA
jgi:NDP-sugar pyrophosphorylase family protein